MTAPVATAAAAEVTAPAAPVAPTPAAPTTDANGAPLTPFEQASAVLRARGSTWGESPVEPTAAAPEAPAAAPVAADPAAADAPPEFSQDAAGRWHRADGTYATATETADLDEQAAADEATETEPPAAPLHKAELRLRDGTMREIEVDDPELAEAIRTNHNDGMRAKQYREKVASVDARAAEFNAFETMLKTNPEAVVFEALSEDKRVKLATMLLAQYWDAIVPTIQQFDTDPSQRVAATMETQLAMRDQRSTYEQTVSANQNAAQIARVVGTLIPETWDAETEASFLADAETDIGRAARAGQRITPESIPALLARRLTMYGAAAPPVAQPEAPKPAVRFAAAPSAPAASGTAARPVGAAAVDLATAQAAQSRIRSAAIARRAAAAVPPAGAGAAPVRQPSLPSSATLADAVAEQKKLRGWGA